MLLGSGCCVCCCCEFVDDCFDYCLYVCGFVEIGVGDELYVEMIVLLWYEVY